MMKRSWLFVLMVAASGTAHAQVAAAVRRDSARFVVEKMTAARIREMKDDFERIARINEAREAQLVRDMRDSTKWRMTEELQDQMMKTTLELNRRRSELTLACAMSRPRLEIPGTLGIDTRNDSIMWLQRMDNGEKTLTMMFGTVPPRITGVTPGSPADKAGVQPGDVWLSFNGKSLVGSVDMRELMRPGSPAEFRVRRNGNEITLPPVTVAKKEIVDFPDYPADVCESLLGSGASFVMAAPLMTDRSRGSMGPTPQPSRAAPQRGTMTLRVTGKLIIGGATIQALDEDWKEMVGTSDGVGVFDVARGAPAAIWGLRKFDVIKEVNGKPVTFADFSKTIRTPEQLTLTVYRKGSGTRTVTIPAR
jgi:hypothetical protein